VKIRKSVIAPAVLALGTLTAAAAPAAVTVAGSTPSVVAAPAMFYHG